MCARATERSDTLACPARPLSRFQPFRPFYNPVFARFSPLYPRCLPIVGSLPQMCLCSLRLAAVARNSEPFPSTNAAFKNLIAFTCTYPLDSCQTLKPCVRQLIRLALSSLVFATYLSTSPIEPLSVQRVEIVLKWNREAQDGVGWGGAVGG